MDIKSVYLFLLALLVFTYSCKEKESPINKKNYYTEQHRPQFHFSPEAHWMNDPNGMVYLDGEYHLFYQYYPDSNVWGPMHWAHAVSKDILHWHHLPIALYPDSLGYIFSGSAVIDKNNTSGFGKDAMVAIFTHHNMDGEKAGTNTFQYQSIAYSLDKGRTFTKFNGNPVLKNPGIKDFRDPKVIWHEASKKWVMVLAVYDKVHFYDSPDLKSWEKTGEFGIEGDDRLWECPDLFPMKVKGSNETKWILITSIQQKAPNGGTATSYFVGDFDGNTFKGDSKKQHWLDYGKDNYAMVTWSNVQDGRTLALGWMSNWQYAQVVPTTLWRSAMTLPRELTLHQLGQEYYLYSNPVKEISTILKNELVNQSPKEIHGTTTITSDTSSLKRMQISFLKPKTENIVIRCSNENKEYIDVGYELKTNRYFIDRTNSGESSFSPDFAGIHYGSRIVNSDTLQFDIFLDHSSVELFADDGSCVMTEIFFSRKPFSTVEIISNEKIIIFNSKYSGINGTW